LKPPISAQGQKTNGGTGNSKCGFGISEKAKSRTDKKRGRNRKRVSGELMEGVVTTK
jgi:hypothetical protein